jgi:hypothetical protein
VGSDWKWLQLIDSLRGTKSKSTSSNRMRQEGAKWLNDVYVRINPICCYHYKTLPLSYSRSVLYVTKIGQFCT